MASVSGLCGLGVESDVGAATGSTITADGQNPALPIIRNIP